MCFPAPDPIATAVCSTGTTLRGEAGCTALRAPVRDSSAVHFIFWKKYEGGSVGVCPQRKQPFSVVFGVFVVVVFVSLGIKGTVDSPKAANCKRWSLLNSVMDDPGRSNSYHSPLPGFRTPLLLGLFVVIKF